ncbi:tetratricopeptide repeat protein [Tundrisphaera lichenicola]|uniref:tetratricopeptide repeat protein n=1 Tax=Tundrisphaera lichenicola TaxID=2029860 RepID=UPI003EBF5D8C
MGQSQVSPGRKTGWGWGRQAALGIVGLLAIAALMSWLMSDPSASIRKSVRESLAARQYDLARERIARWAEERPRDGEPSYYRARLEVLLDKPVEALAAIQESLDRGYPPQQLMVLRAILLARAGQLEQAELPLRAAIEDPDGLTPEIAEALTRVYMGNFRVAEAAKVIDRWMEAAPDDPRPYLRRIQVDERMEPEPAQSMNNYREALRRDPKLASARLGLAELLLSEYRNDEAEVEFEKYLELEPKGVPGHIGAGKVAFLKGDIQGATEHFKEALAINPRSMEALREFALIELRIGRVESAIDHFKQAIEIAPFDFELHYNYSRALKSAGQDDLSLEEAAISEKLRKESDRVLELRNQLVARPSDTELRCEVAKWLIENGHEAEGLEWTNLILRQKPGHQATCRLLADYYAKKGNHGLANYYQMAGSLQSPH